MPTWAIPFLFSRALELLLFLGIPDLFVGFRITKSERSSDSGNVKTDTDEVLKNVFKHVLNKVSTNIVVVELAAQVVST